MKTSFITISNWIVSPFIAPDRPPHDLSFSPIVWLKCALTQSHQIDHHPQPNTSNWPPHHHPHPTNTKSVILFLTHSPISLQKTTHILSLFTTIGWTHNPYPSSPITKTAPKWPLILSLSHWIPWMSTFLLQSQQRQKNKLKPIPKAHKSFVDALNNVCDIPSNQFSVPIMKGARFSITTPEEEYLSGSKSCKSNLHARIVWPKGSIPLTVVALKEKLNRFGKTLFLRVLHLLGKVSMSFCFPLLRMLEVLG